MTNTLILPDRYKPVLGTRDTEQAIRLIKEFFQTHLAFELNLVRVTAPKFVQAGTGVNDDLNGVEEPVSFTAKSLKGMPLEVVQSLAKWKRMMLADYGFRHGEGLYTDMDAIRPDETLDNLHSIYVDQWDWERVMAKEERTVAFLKQIVTRIYRVIKTTEEYVCYHYPAITPALPETITFLHAEELEAMYPRLMPRERETTVAREYGAVFIIGIGGALKNGQPHDGRAPDYDDWSTLNEAGYHGLNGDILVFNQVLDTSFELSSMGIRVDAAALERQLDIRGMGDRRELMFHQRLLKGEWPLSIGGGIGQSRLCMLYLHKAHIGEIQVSVWPQDMIAQCRANSIRLL
jgi:aspartate--ammonia ligase